MTGCECVNMWSCFDFDRSSQRSRTKKNYVCVCVCVCIVCVNNMRKNVCVRWILKDDARCLSPYQRQTHAHTHTRTHTHCLHHYFQSHLLGFCIRLLTVLYFSSFIIILLSIICLSLHQSPSHAFLESFVLSFSIEMLPHFSSLVCLRMLLSSPASFLLISSFLLVKSQNGMKPFFNPTYLKHNPFNYIVASTVSF